MIRVFGLGILIAACGGSEGNRDAAVARDADVDAARDASAVDASIDPDAGGCACAAFERCEGGACVCDGDEALCGTRGYAGFPMRDPSERTFVLEGADVVRDEVTGLRWMRVSESARPWDEARDFCAAATFGGRDDWRLPARVELASILDAGRTPSFDTAFFEGAADYVWTASRPAGSDVAAFAIYFGQGETVSAGVAVGGGHVRCVAGARDAVVVGTVDGEHVRHGGLRWRRTVSEPSDYAGAAAFCEALGERLPSLYEMHDLVDEAREAPAIDGLLFPETPTDRYWTSTIRDFGEILSWTVDFVIGASELVERSTTARARCVSE